MKKDQKVLPTLLLIKGIPTLSVSVLRSVNQPEATEEFLQLFTETSKIPQLLSEENKCIHTPPHQKTLEVTGLDGKLKNKALLI